MKQLDPNVSVIKRTWETALDRETAKPKGKKKLGRGRTSKEEKPTFRRTAS